MGKHNPPYPLVLTSLFLGFAACTAGCTGMKEMSYANLPGAQFHHKQLIPPDSSLSIRPLRCDTPSVLLSEGCLDSGRKVGAHFAKCTKKKLLKTKLFRTVEVIGPQDDCKTDYLLEGEIYNHQCGFGDWASRVMVPTTNSLALRGRLVKVDTQTEVCNFTLGRHATGGALGAGGLLSAEGTTMGKQISEWLGDDFCSLFRHANKR